MKAIWLHQVQLLRGPGAELELGDALLGADGRLEALGVEASRRAAGLGLSPRPAGGSLLAPVLVDPHSVLDDPWTGQAETLTSLAEAAARGGYGTVALLPWARPWRDRPERLNLSWPAPLQLLLWGSFSRDGADTDLALHALQVAAGAIGLAGGPECPPLALLERGLLLAEAPRQPLLVAPRQLALTSGGFVREGVEALRAGWPIDPQVSETLPLQSLLTLAATGSGQVLNLMNLSTAAGVAALERAPWRPPATVAWWHLVADSGSLSPTAEGWRLEPSLGTPGDRQALIAALAAGTLSAVAVHHQALDAEEQMLPLDQRPPGIAGHGGHHGLVLPALWHALVRGRGWSAAQLWQVLSWGPSGLLQQPAERLVAGSRRWLLFDPEAQPSAWGGGGGSLAANQPGPPQACAGAVRATGLTAPDQWWLDPAAPGAAAFPPG